MESLPPSQLEIVKKFLAEKELDLRVSQENLQTTFDTGPAFEWNRDRIAYLGPLIEKLREIVEAHKDAGE